METENRRLWILTTATSDFMSFIRWLNSQSIDYFIAWGYEQLPEIHSGGDVDICVNPQHYMMVEHELRLRGFTPANCARHGEGHYHGHFGSPNEFTIEIFSSLCFGYEGKITVLNISYEHFTHAKRGEILISSPVTEALFTNLRVLGGRKDCLKRLEKFLG